MTDSKFGYGMRGEYQIVDDKQFEERCMGCYGWVIIDKIVKRVPVEDVDRLGNSRSFMRDQQFAPPHRDQYGNATSSDLIGEQTVYEDRLMLIVMRDEDSQLAKLNSDIDVAQSGKQEAEFKLEELEKKVEKIEAQIAEQRKQAESALTMLDDQRKATNLEREARRKLEEALGKAQAELAKVREALGTKQMRDILEGTE